MWYVFLKKSEKWTLVELEQYQLKKLKELLVFSDKYSKYYQDKFDDLNLKPQDVFTLADFEKYPITNKKDLIKSNKLIYTKKNFKNLKKAITSGSTGESLQFDREESSDSFNRASIFRGYSWYGINPWDNNGYFWGFNFSELNKMRIAILDALQNRFRLFSYQEKELNSFLKKLKNAKYLHGYSSIIYQTARIINKKKIPNSFNLKMVKGTSEKVFDNYQEEVTKAFGVRMISEYGSAETGIIAFECVEGNMHINMEGVIVEELKNEIVVTNLQLKSFPIIRYKLGDYIKLAPKDKECKCGLKHQMLEEVTGRVGDNIFGENEVYPSLYIYYIFKNLSKENNLLLNYQVRHKVKGQLQFNISEKLNKNELKLLSNQIYKYFSDDIKFEIFDNKTFKVGKNKLKNFISNVSE
jgi:phenylacetate-CoA ligase